MSPPDDARRRAAMSSRDLRKRRARRVALRVALWVVIPTAVASIYYGLVASAQYESVAVVAIRGAETPGLDEGSLHKMAPRSSPSRDAELLRQYVRSREVLTLLVEEHELAEHYRSADLLSRLGGGASFEDTYDYYLGKLEIAHEPDATALTLRVRAFSPERAQAFARAIVSATEEMVSRLSEREQEEVVRFAERELVAAERRLAEARVQAAPVQAAGAHGSEPELVELELSSGAYKAALRALEAARLEAGRDRRYLVTIAAPSLPDAASRPRRAWSVLTVSVASFALMIILTVLLGAVREHAKL